MQSPRNISDAVQTPDTGAMGRAIGVFKKSGGILNTKRAVELGVHPRELYMTLSTSSMRPSASGTSSDGAPFSVT
jgi:hypothetical protein